MTVTRQMVADRIAAYLQSGGSLSDLVDWAETAAMDSEFESEQVRDAVALIGLADVRAFGLTWEDCQRILGDLGFAAKVDVAAIY